MPRFFVEDVLGDTVTIEGQDARHIACALRMQTGDTLTVCDGKGVDCLCELTAVSPDTVMLEVKERTKTQTEPSIAVTLYQGLPKGDKLEWIIQKAVELGVTRIVPVVCSRSIAKAGEKDAKKTARRQKIADEAAGQCGRGILPVVEAPITFAEAAKRMEKEHTIVFYECGGEPLPALAPRFADKLSIFIGPEGGIAPQEMDTLLQNGAVAATLGPRILRCETAPIAALSAIMVLSGNL